MNAYSYIELPADAFFPANRRPDGIDLGSCVRFNPRCAWSTVDLTEEGVVIEVVDPGRPFVSKRIAARTRPCRSRIRRYVVESGSGRLVRHAGTMEVDAL